MMIGSISFEIFPEMGSACRKCGRRYVMVSFDGDVAHTWNEIYAYCPDCCGVVEPDKTEATGEPEPGNS